MRSNPFREKINPMHETALVIEFLLKEYGVDMDDDDLGQDIINACVSIDNAYHGYDNDGNLVGTVEDSPTQPKHNGGTE